MTKKGHKCIECRDRFESLEKLREHEKDCGMMYRCMKCYAWYENKRHLEEHKKRDHPKEDEQKCKKCEKRIEDPEELKEHQEDCGTYWCGPCDKRFTKKSVMLDHKNRKHPKEDGNNTKIEQNIEKHDWKCHLCQKQYRCKKELEEHEEENHNCYLCQKQYRCKNELDEHEEEDHRWRCDKCRNGYIEIEELDEHLRK